MRKILALLVFLSVSIAYAAAPDHTIPAGSKVFIEPMNGFDTSLAAAILKKKLDLVVVDESSKADYIITGRSETQSAGWAKTIFVSPLGSAHASIAVKEIKTGALVFAYSVDKSSARRGEQSTAEACAKHLKDVIK